jgi:FAD binding domain
MTRNDVLIIGAGPSGLFAAAELVRHGAGVRLIEREVRLHRETRATTIQPGTLEILDSVGLLPPFLEAAEHVQCTRMYGLDLSELRVATFEGIDCRCEFQCILPQYETQRILEAHLESLGGMVERGLTATKLERDATGFLYYSNFGRGHCLTDPDTEGTAGRVTRKRTPRTGPRACGDAIIPRTSSLGERGMSRPRTTGDTSSIATMRTSLTARSNTLPTYCRLVRSTRPWSTAASTGAFRSVMFGA